MLNPFIEKCIDINTEFCPCLLADTNHCTFCSKLQGKETCDCNWSGVCIFYEKYWQDKYKKSNQITQRIIEECIALKQEQIGTKTYQLEFCVSKELAKKLDRPGSFVFLRRLSDPACSHFPVGVMKVNDTKITVAIEAVGAKSSRFLLNSQEKIHVRGPYYNGVLGKPWIDSLADSTVVVVAGGIGQAPALPILKQLLVNNNKIYLIAAPGKVQEIFIKPDVKHKLITLYGVTTLRGEGFAIFHDLLKRDIALVISAGPDAQHSGIIRLMHDNNINIPMAATNNAVMCCGEGLCGSCCQLTQGNKTVKMCKTQLNYQDLIQD